MTQPATLQWEHVAGLRSMADTYLESLDPSGVAQHDHMVTVYKQALVDMGLDLGDERTLHAYGAGLLNAGNMIIALTQEQCEAGPEAHEHVASHVRVGVLRLALVWRDALAGFELLKQWQERDGGVAGD